MQFDNKISAILSYKPLQLISLPHVQSCLLRGKKKAPSKILLECVSLCHCALRKGKPPLLLASLRIDWARSSRKKVPPFQESCFDAGLCESSLSI